MWALPASAHETSWSPRVQFMCIYMHVCVWPLWRTVPNIEEFESIEQHPFLHVVINLLIGSKAWSSIDLPERRRERDSKNILGVFFYFILFFFSLFSIQQTEMLCNYRSGFRASCEKSDLFPQKGEKRRERWRQGFFFSLKDTLELLAFAWA